ncbi:MAG: hypothetical protein JW702_04325 [Clostridiales bacterium]|nr:hypothetical protein [Clostridiales bacterium]
MLSMMVIQVVLIITAVMISFKIYQNIQIDKWVREIFYVKDRSLLYIGDEFDLLPLPLKKYIILTGARNKKAFKKLKIYYRGMIKRKSNKRKWWWFKLKSYVNFDTHSYLADACMSIVPGITIRVIDMLERRIGHFVIYLGGMFKFVEGLGTEMNYRNEMVYLLFHFLSPAYLTHENFKWEEKNGEVIGLFKDGKVDITGRFVFDSEGKLLAIHFNRYRNVKNDFVLTEWTVEIEKYGNWLGFYLPTTFNFIYHLPKEDFHYARLEIIKMYID